MEISILNTIVRKIHTINTTNLIYTKVQHFVNKSKIIWKCHVNQVLKWKSGKNLRVNIFIQFVDSFMFIQFGRVSASDACWPFLKSSFDFLRHFAIPNNLQVNVYPVWTIAVPKFPNVPATFRQGCVLPNPSKESNDYWMPENFHNKFISAFNEV